MLRPLAELIDDYRIWHKVTFQRGRILKTSGSSWEQFDREEHYQNPRLVYAADGVVPAISTSTSSTGGLAEVTRFTFPTLHPIRGYPYAETNTAAGWLYRNLRSGRAPVVVLAHGWAHEGARALETLYIRPLVRAGFSVAMLSQPFHFERAPAGTYSGELMVTGDVVLTVEAFRQAVADLNGLVNWIRDSSGDLKVGVMGYSLGGYIAGLLACLRDDLDFVVIAGAGHSLVSPILDTGLGVNVREDLSWSGMDRREDLERAWGIISPGRLRLRVPRERVLLLAGFHDRIMLRQSVESLWERWSRPAVRFEREGHYTLLAMPGRIVRRSLPFLRLRLEEDRWEPRIPE